MPQSSAPLAAPLAAPRRLQLGQPQLPQLLGQLGLGQRLEDRPRLGWQTAPLRLQLELPGLLGLLGRLQPAQLGQLELPGLLGLLGVPGQWLEDRPRLGWQRQLAGSTSNRRHPPPHKQTEYKGMTIEPV